MGSYEMDARNWINATVPLVLSEIHSAVGYEKAELRLFADGHYEMEPLIMALFPVQMGVTIPGKRGDLPAPANVTLYKNGTYLLESIKPNL